MIYIFGSEVAANFQKSLNYRGGPVTILTTALRRALLAAFLIAVFASQTYAIATYTFVSDNYTFAEPPFNMSMHIEASFTVDTPFPANFGPTDISADLLSFEVTDGLSGSLSSGDPELTIQAFTIGTDLNGNINSWTIKLRSPGFPFLGVNESTREIALQFGSSTSDLFLCVAAGAQGCTDISPIASAVAQGIGTWTRTITAVPEPGSLFLLLSGFAGLGLLRRFR